MKKTLDLSISMTGEDWLLVEFLGDLEFVLHEAIGNLQDGDSKDAFVLLRDRVIESRRGIEESFGVQVATNGHSGDDVG